MPIVCSRYILLAILLMVVASLLTTPAVAAGNDRKPNILLIFVDDLGYGELGCQGNPEIKTPNIDKIAKQGVRFTNGYVSSPYCCPSRAGLLTGRYQTRFGHELNVVGKGNLREDIGLPVQELTIANLLKSAGYVTGCIGKWHLGGTAKYHPQKRGFDEFYGFLHEGHFFAPEPYKGLTTRLRPNEPPYDESNPILRGTKVIQEKEYLTDAITREALSFMERHRNDPFFLYLSYNAVHSPMQAPHKYLDRNDHITDSHRRLFAAMLTSLDDGIGRVLEKLDELKIGEQTLVIFLSDNGGPVAELTSSNWPLRGGKGQLWEGGVRIPFMMMWPGHLPAGKTYDQPVISLDILPTAVSLAGGKLPMDRKIDGVNLLPYLQGKKTGPPHSTLFWRYGPNIAMRQGNWKLVKQTEGGQKQAKFRLFDLSKDWGETTDLAAKMTNRVASMQRELQQWNSEMVPPLWGRR